jgi:hypothetical protein
MGVAHLGPEEMAYFTDPTRRDPRAVRVEGQIRDYAERTGGLTLEYWQLALGHVWGRPHMMTMDEAAKRLARPISELQRIDEETNRALGWGHGEEASTPRREV